MTNPWGTDDPRFPILPDCHLFARLGTANVAFGPDGSVVMANEKAHLLWPGGADRDPDVRACVEQVLVQGHYETLRFFRQTPGGPRWFQAHFHVLEGDQGALPGVLLIAADATETRRWEDWQSRLEREQGLGLLAGSVARDLNNLLAGVMGLLDSTRLNLRLGRVEAGLERLDRAGGLFDQGKELLVRLLAWARESPPVRQVLDLGELIVHWTKEFAPGWEVEFRLGDADLTCPGDAAQLRFLWSQVLANACEASPPGSRLVVSIEPVVHSPDHLTVCLVDSGSGISPEVAERLFSPFFTTKPDHPGLGLSTARAIAERHGGWLDVGPASPQGTQVTLGLPRFTLHPEPDPSQLLFPFEP